MYTIYADRNVSHYHHDLWNALARFVGTVGHSPITIGWNEVPTAETALMLMGNRGMLRAAVEVRSLYDDGNTRVARIDPDGGITTYWE